MPKTTKNKLNQPPQRLNTESVTKHLTHMTKHAIFKLLTKQWLKSGYNTDDNHLQGGKEMFYLITLEHFIFGYMGHIVEDH